MKVSCWCLVIRLTVALFAMAISPIAGAESAACSSFREVKASDGASLYMITESYQDLDATQALNEYKKIAVEKGYLIAVKPSEDGAAARMGIGRPPSPNPTLILVDKKSSMVSLTTIVAPGHQAVSSDVKAELCGLIARFDASRPSSQAGRGREITAEQAEEESRTTIPVATPSLRLLSPDVPFDAAAAKDALQPGNSVIRGKVCAFYKGTMILGSGSKVALYPATPYFEQLIKLAKKAKAGREQVVPDQSALSTRMVATANKAGEFQFSKMKTGRYFLITSVSAVLGGSRDVYAGHVSDGFGSANVYTRENFSFGASNEISKFVEVRNDGDTVKVTLQPPLSGNPFHRGMSGALFGCHQPF